MDVVYLLVRYKGMLTIRGFTAGFAVNRVSSVSPNVLDFTGHPADAPLAVRPALLNRLLPLASFLLFPSCQPALLAPPSPALLAPPPRQGGAPGVNALKKPVQSVAPGGFGLDSQAVRARMVHKLVAHLHRAHAARRAAHWAPPQHHWQQHAAAAAHCGQWGAAKAWHRAAGGGGGCHGGW